MGAGPARVRGAGGACRAAHHLRDAAGERCRADLPRADADRATVRDCCRRWLVGCRWSAGAAAASNPVGARGVHRSRRGCPGVVLVAALEAATLYPAADRTGG